MSLADIFVARDGDASVPGEIIAIAVIAAVLIGAAAWCHRRRQQRKRALAEQMAELREFAAVNREHLEMLASDEERLGRVVGEIRHYVTGAAADSRPHLKVVKG